MGVTRKFMTLLTVAFTGLIFLPLYAAEGYNCKNKDVEVACLNAKCEINESFTPVEISLKRHMEICAYSGCTKYHYRKSTTQNYEIYSTVNTKVLRKENSIESAIFVFDKADNTGMLKFGALILPMACY